MMARKVIGFVYCIIGLAISVVGSLLIYEQEGIPLISKIGLWASIGMWFSLVVIMFGLIRRHKWSSRFDALSKESEAMRETAAMYRKMGMMKEAQEALDEAKRLNDAAGRALEGKE